MLSRPALRSLAAALAAPTAPTRSAMRSLHATPRAHFARPAVRPVQRPSHSRQSSLSRRQHSTPPPPPPPPPPHYSSHAPQPPREERLRLPTDVPPISERLRPLIPFLFWWTVITSLAVHLLRKRKANEEEIARLTAQQTVLEDMIASFARGEPLADDEIRRELEMVGLRRRKLTLDPDTLERVRQQVGSGPALAEYARETLAKQAEEGGADGDSVRPDLSELRKVTWLEVLLGRRRGEKARDTITEDGEIVKLLAEGKSEEEAKAIAKERVEKMHEEDAVKEWSESEPTYRNIADNSRRRGEHRDTTAAVSAGAAAGTEGSCQAGDRRQRLHVDPRMHTTIIIIFTLSTSRPLCSSWLRDEMRPPHHRLHFFFGRSLMLISLRMRFGVLVPGGCSDGLPAYQSPRMGHQPRWLSSTSMELSS